MARQPALTPAAAKAAMAAGVKPAAIVNYENYVPRAAPVVPAPAKKKEPRPKAKAALHRDHVPARPLPAKQSQAKVVPTKSVSAKSMPAKPAPLQPDAVKPVPAKPKENAPVPAPKNSAALHPVAAARVSSGAKKPSAAIKKETPQN
jgi:hypothetical protein